MQETSKLDSSSLIVHKGAYKRVKVDKGSLGKLQECMRKK